MENYIELEDLLTINYQFENPLQNVSATTFEQAEQADVVIDGTSDFWGCSRINGDRRILIMVCSEWH